jgi:hypothetical protein
MPYCAAQQADSQLQARCKMLLLSCRPSCLVGGKLSCQHRPLCLQPMPASDSYHQFSCHPQCCLMRTSRSQPPWRLRLSSTC